MPLGSKALMRLDPRALSLLAWALDKEAWMLVITRKEGERIVVDDDIVITVIESNRGSVRIGVDAPRELSITREELGSAPME